jgi:hypothetical protein
MRWLKMNLLECYAIQPGKNLPVFLNKPVAFIFEYEKMRDKEGGTDWGGGGHREVAPLKHQQISTRLYGITSQKTLFFTVIYVRISHLKTLLSHQTVSTLLVL